MSSEKVGITENPKAEASSSSSSTDTFSNYAMHLITDADFNEAVLDDVIVDEKKLENLRVTRMSHAARRLLRHFGDSPKAAEIIIFAEEAARAQRSIIVLPLPSIHHTFPNTAKNALYSTRHIAMGEFIIAPVPVHICRPLESGRSQMGMIWKDIVLFNGFQSDFSSFQVVDAPKTSRKRKRGGSASSYREKRARSSSQLLSSDDENGNSFIAYDKYDLCIDVTAAPDELRAIRRNCAPNLVIRYVLLDQRIELFICARRDIQEGEELTLPHDYDSNFSTKLLQCAHPYHEEEVCLHEVHIFWQSAARFFAVCYRRLNSSKCAPLRSVLAAMAGSLPPSKYHILFILSLNFVDQNWKLVQIGVKGT